MSGSWPPRLIGHFKKMARSGVNGYGLIGRQFIGGWFLVKDGRV